MSAVLPGSRWAVEIRDESWLADPVLDVLRNRGAALVVHDMIEGHPRVVTTNWSDVPLHGPRAPHHPHVGRYGPDRLAEWVDRCEETAARGHDIFVHFDNDVGGAAVLDAREMRSLLGDRRAGSASGRRGG